MRQKSSNKRAKFCTECCLRNYKLTQSHAMLHVPEMLLLKNNRKATNRNETNKSCCRDLSINAAV